MERKIEVQETQQPSEGGQFLAAHDDEVKIWEGSKRFVYVVRFPHLVWQTISEPEKRIKEHFSRCRLPKRKTVMDYSELGITESPHGKEGP